MARPSRPGSTITKHDRRQAKLLARIIVHASVRNSGRDKSCQMHVVLAIPPGKEDAVAQAFRQATLSADIAVKSERVEQLDCTYCWNGLGSSSEMVGKALLRFAEAHYCPLAQCCPYDRNFCFTGVSDPDSLRDRLQ